MPVALTDSTATPHGQRSPTTDQWAGSKRPILQYLSSLIQIARWQLVAAVVIMTITSLTEGLGVALLFPILQVAGFNLANQGHVGHYTGEVRVLLVRSGLAPTLWLATLLLIFMLLMALRSLFSRVQSVLTFRTVLKYELALSRRLYQAIINADWLFLVRRRSSDFTHALTAELARVANGTYLLIGTVANAILALVYIALALKLSAGMTSLVLATGAALLLVSRRWMRAVHESGTAVSESVSEVYSAATEHLQNLKAMKFYDAQTSDLAMFSSLQSSALQQSLANTRSQAAAAFWFEAGSLAVLGAIIFASLQILNVAPASILLLLAVFTRLIPRLAAGQSQLQAFLSELPAFENLMTIYRGCVANAEVPSAPGPGPSLAQEIRLERVSFQYEAQRPHGAGGVVADHRRGKDHRHRGFFGRGKEHHRRPGQWPAFPDHWPGSGRRRGTYAADRSRLAPPGWLRGPGHRALSRHGAGELALGKAGRLRTGNARGSQAWPPPSSSSSYRRDWIPPWGTAACFCPMANGSASRWLARCCASLGCSFLTRRPAVSISRTRSESSTRSNGCKAGRRS